MRGKLEEDVVWNQEKDFSQKTKNDSSISQSWCRTQSDAESTRPPKILLQSNLLDTQSWHQPSFVTDDTLAGSKFHQMEDPVHYSRKISLKVHIVFQEIKEGSSGAQDSSNCARQTEPVGGCKSLLCQKSVGINSGQALKNVQDLWTIGSVIGDNLLSRIHHSAILQNGKTTMLNSVRSRLWEPRSKLVSQVRFVAVNMRERLLAKISAGSLLSRSQTSLYWIWHMGADFGTAEDDRWEEEWVQSDSISRWNKRENTRSWSSA